MNKEYQKIFDKLKESKEEPLHLNSKVLLVDSLNTFLRSFVKIKQLNPHGHHVGGLTGFLKSVGHLVRLIRPTRVILVFDGAGSSAARKNLYPEYKANRPIKRITNWEGFDTKEEESESIADQLLRLIAYLKCLPIDLLVIDKAEADDVIGYLTRELPEEVYIASTDEDYLQLISNRVTVYSPIKKKFYTPSVVKQEFGISTFNFLNYRVIAGDKGDNIAGIKGLKVKKILKFFPELKEDRRYTLDEIVKISVDKSAENKVYATILLYEKQLKINNLLMNLQEPILMESSKKEIQEVLLSPNRKYDALAFLKLYNTDLLEGSITNPQMWLHDTFRYLLAYNLKPEL